MSRCFGLEKLLILLAITVLVSQGCVRRRLTVRTNPPGALVYVDDQEIGTTPTSTHFIYYGTRKLRIVKDGYETLTLAEKIKMPWYQYPGIDYIAENLWPWEVRDERIVDVSLVPRRIVPTSELVQRANELRHGAQNGYVTQQPEKTR